MLLIYVKEVIIIIYERMLAEHLRLEEQIRSLQSKLQTLPSGKIICTRNGNRYKWYQSDGHIPTYIPKKNRSLAEQLALKKYLTEQLKYLTHEKNAIELYLRYHDSNINTAEKMLTDQSEYQKLLSPYFQPTSQKLHDWMTSPYESNSKHPEQLIHKTSSGNFVRSKSEALIDMVLHTNRIPFRYECALHLSESTIYPDFTVRHPQTGKIYYWEHFGLMDDPTYCKNMCSKLQLYTSHGIIPNIQLITTYETKDNPLSFETIENTIQKYFL